MKKLIIIILLLIGVFAEAQIQDSLQDEYYREIDWKFYPDSVVVVAQDTYLFKAEPFDYNDPGAIERTVGNYVVDFVGHRYLVIDSTSTTITVHDEYRTGQAPQTGQVSRCYKSVVDGEAPYIGSVDYSVIDLSARWKIDGADKELFWRHRSALHDSIQFDRDAVITGYNAWKIEPDTINGTLVFYNDESEIAMQMGQELWIKIKNNNGSTFLNGIIVYISGGESGFPVVSIADNHVSSLTLETNSTFVNRGTLFRVPPSSRILTLLITNLKGNTSFSK